MEAFICTACGTQYTPSNVAPRQCVICEEERQYVPPRGQTWTTLAALAAGHFNSYRQYEPGVIGIGTQPQFAIGQRALVVCTPNGNVLWDCIAMLDPATIALINGLGSLKAIAVLTGLVLVGVDRVGDVHFFASNAFTRFSNSPNRRPISCTPLIILWTWSGNMFGLFSLAKLSMALTKVEMDMTDLHLLLAANLALASTR